TAPRHAALTPSPYQERTMGIIGLVLFGLVAGALAHLVLPRRRVGGVGVTAALAVAGSLVGGLAGSLLTGEGLQLGPAGLVGAVVGVLLAVVAASRRGRPTDPGAHHA